MFTGNYQEIQKCNLAIIRGDFNAKIGKEETQNKAAGKFSIHNIGNENGIFTRTVCYQKWIEAKQVQHSHIKVYI
jgi:hypothetical protein